VEFYPRGTKIPDPSNGIWVGIEMEVFKALYPRGSDGFDLGERYIPIRAWVITVFSTET
jgi:hypothetical protein